GCYCLRHRAHPSFRPASSCWTSHGSGGAYPFPRDTRYSLVEEAKIPQAKARRTAIRPLVAALLVCAASLTPSPLPLHGHGAGPTVVTLLGNMAFLSPNRGWVEVSSSAGYSLFCYQ